MSTARSTSFRYVAASIAADARGAAHPEVEVQAGLLREPHAPAEPEQVREQALHGPGLAHARVRAEEEEPRAALRPADEEDAGKLLVERDREVGEAAVVLQEDVVRRLVLLDEARLEEERLAFGSRRDELDARAAGDDRAVLLDLRAQMVEDASAKAASPCRRRRPRCPRTGTGTPPAGRGPPGTPRAWRRPAGSPERTTGARSARGRSCPRARGRHDRGSKERCEEAAGVRPGRLRHRPRGFRRRPRGRRRPLLRGPGRSASRRSSGRPGCARCTTIVLPPDRSRNSTSSSFCTSAKWRPVVGSSRRNSVRPVGGFESSKAILIRWASPPESVVALWPRRT